MPALAPVLLVLAAFCALLAILCEERADGRHRAFYLLKPLTTLLVLAAAASAHDADPVLRAWTCAALALSLAGDVALMFPGTAAFMAGLGSFLVAHLLFAVAFLLDARGLPPAWSLVPLLAGLAFFAWLLPRTGALRLPVSIYGVAITAMMLAASARAATRGDPSGWLAAAGAGIFMFSDAALAVRRFRGPYPRAQAVILASYWLAIGLLAAAVLATATLAPQSAAAHHKAITTATSGVTESRRGGRGGHPYGGPATVL